MIGRALDQFSLFLGPARLRALFLLIAMSGLISLILNVIVDEYDWVRTAQSALTLIAVVGAAILIGGRMDASQRGRWLLILAPAFLALGLSMTVLQAFALPLIGAAVGWVFVGLFLFRARTPPGYRAAIRALRKGNISDAIDSMDALIREEPEDVSHYRFRAELLRLDGQLERALRDYHRMIEIEPESALGHNGLAEVELQSGNYERARAAAERAVELAPGDWIALYNLGMIEDRLRASEQVIEHLTQALGLRVPDARHRVLMHLYLLRAYIRLGRTAEADEQLVAIRRQRAGLDEWQHILSNAEAEVLKRVLGEDVEQARALERGELLPAAAG